MSQCHSFQRLPTGLRKPLNSLPWQVMMRPWWSGPCPALWSPSVPPAPVLAPLQTLQPSFPSWNMPPQGLFPTSGPLHMLFALLGMALLLIVIWTAPPHVLGPNFIFSKITLWKLSVSVSLCFLPRFYHNFQVFIWNCKLCKAGNSVCLISLGSSTWEAVGSHKDMLNELMKNFFHSTIF